MSQGVDWLVKACTELHLRVQPSVDVALPDGSTVHSLALLPELGAANGMLLVQSYEEIRAHAEQLVAAGYGYSVLDPPGPREQFDLESFKEMFVDWGWSGTLARKPTWMP